MRIGISRNSNHITPKIAPSDWQDARISDAGYSAKIVIDTLDNLNFPRYGLNIAAEAYFSQEPLGADYQYSIYQAKAAVPVTFGRNTIVPFVKAGSCYGLDREMDSVVYFTLGGFQNLSGMYPDEVMGDQMLLGKLQYFFTG